MTMRYVVRVAWLLCLALPSGTRAQVAGAQYCGSGTYNDNVSVEGAGTVDRMHPLLARARYAEAARNEQWELALRGLRDDATQAFVAARVSPAHEALFLSQLDLVLRLIQRLPGVGDTVARAAFIADSIKPIRFHPVPGVDSYRLFTRADTISVAGLNAEQTKALCWSAMSIDVVLFRLKVPLEGRALARLARLNTSWANYRTYGYTRQPLELLLFRGSVHDSLPRSTQWLVAHLSLGAELRGSSSDSLTSEPATVLEFGVIRYRSNYTQYAGLSAIAGFASGQTIGYGAMVHVARSLRGGVLVRRSRGTTSRSIVMSTDLYGLLERSKKSVEDGLAIARGIVTLPSSDEK
jgi:hypothetical protein